MTNLLKVEFYKLLRNKSFLALLLFSSILGSILMLDNKLPSSAADCFYSALYNTPLLYFLVIIFGALFIGEEFDSHTLCSYISAGHKRSSILFVRIFSFFIAAFCIMAAPVLIDSLAGILLFGTGGMFCTLSSNTTGNALLKTAVILLSMAAMGMLPVLSAFLFKDVGKTTAVPVGLYFLMIFALNGSHARTAAIILPMGQLRLLSLKTQTLPYLWMIITDVTWITLCWAGSWMAFRRADLK